MNDALEYVIAFNRDQKDLMLDNVRVQWVGARVLLWNQAMTGNPLTEFTAGPDLLLKIQKWCVKNHYRCTQIKDGKIVL